MNDSLSVFSFESRNVRIVLIDNEPWFVAKDVCSILEIKNVSDALARLDVDERSTIVLNDSSPNPYISIISESGMYALILSSRKPEAKPFRKWVTSEVLPQIRKTGSYQLNTQLPKTFAEALQLAADQAKAIELLEQEKQLLELENNELSEAVDDLFNYSSIVRVAKFNHCSEKSFDWRKLKAATLAMKLEIKRVPCPRFGEKLLYPHEAWRYVYPNYKLPETTTLVLNTTKGG